MAKKKVTLNIDSKIYKDFKKHCEDNAIVLSKKVEIFMNNLLKGKKLVLLFLGIFFISFASAVISVDSVSTNSGDASSYTHSHTVSGTDRLLIVSVELESGASDKTVNSITYGGVSLTQLSELAHSGGDPRTEIWYLVDPNTGGNDVVVTLDGGNANKAAIGVVSYTGVDQAIPIDGTTTAQGISSAASVSVLSESGDLVQDGMASLSQGVPTVGSGQTERWNVEMGGSGASNKFGAGSTEPGGASVTMSWSLTESGEWVIIGFNINAEGGGDVLAPNVTSLTENPGNGSQYISGARYEFNATVLDDGGIDSVLFEFDGVNYTATNLSSDEYNVSVLDLSAGVYGYRWFVNDTAGNVNNSESGFYTVVNATGNVGLLLNGTLGNQTGIFGVQTNASANTSFGSVVLYRNGIDVTGENHGFVGLGVGTYNYTAVSSGDSNHSSESLTRWVHIDKTTPNLTYYLNGGMSNISVVYPQQVNGSGSSDAGTLQIYRDGIAANNGQNYTLGIGYYRFDYNVTGNQNYTNVSEVLFANVTKASQSITGLLNGLNSNLVVTYPQQVNASYSGTNSTEVTIDINGTSVNIGQNYTWGVGSWIVNYSILGNQNYSGFEGYLNLTINQANSEVNLTLNSTEGNITINQGQEILLNGSLITGDNSGRIVLYNNGSLINNGTSSVWNLTAFNSAGEFNISVFYEGSQNYSGSSETYFVNVLAVSSTAPVVNITYPSFASTYNSTSEIALNFTITNTSSLNSCWYTTDEGITNNTISGCVDSEFSVSADGFYNLTLYSNESLNGETGQDNLSFYVSSGLPGIHLGNPSENKYTNQSNLSFIYTPFGNSSISSCELWGDFNGTYGLNQTDISISNDVENNFSLGLIEGNYNWSVLCSDTSGLNSTTGNRTLNVDFTPPDVDITEPSGEYSDGTDIPLDFDVNDSSPVDSCSYTISKTDSGEVVEIKNITNCEDTTITVDTGDNYDIELSGNDAAGNSGPGSSSFSVGSGGSGGGSVGSSTTSNAVLGVEGVQSLTLGDLEILNMKRGTSEFVELEVINSGDRFLNNCKLTATGEVISWVSNRQSESLSSGQKADFIFGVSVPLDAEIKEYNSFIRIDCDEHSESKNIRVNVVSGDFEIFILNAERIPGNRLRVEYSLENLVDSDLDLDVRYVLINEDDVEVLESVETVNVGPNTKKDLSLEFDLPKDSSGDYEIVLEAIRGSEKSSARQDIVLSSPTGLTGLAISDSNLRTLSWFGIVVGILLGVLFVVRFLRKHGKKHRAREAKRHFIKLDLRS